MSVEPAAVFESRFRVRSYELDSFAHLNHAVYLNYFEQARFDALSAGGFTLGRMSERGWAVHVVHVEVDFRREARLGQEMLVRTHVAEARSSSMTLRHVALDPARLGSDPQGHSPDPPGGNRSAAVFAEARVVAVWIGPDGAPMRIPAEVREALGVG